MNRFHHIEPAPTRTPYGELRVDRERIERQRRRSMTLLVCLLPIAILAGWSAVRAITKLFNL